jgi:hypothetical protein
MARVALASPGALGTQVDGSGNARVGMSATIQKRSDSSNVTVYTTESGGTTLANPGAVITDANGNFPGWVDEQSLQAVLGAPASRTVPFEAKNGTPVSASASTVTPDQAWNMVQEGVMSPADGGPLVRNSSSSVTIPGGQAWIDTDAVPGFGTGKVLVQWASTTLSGIPAGDANGRLDQVVVQMVGGFGTLGQVQRVQGTAGQASAVTLANRLGAAALPSAALRLYDLVVTTTGMATTGYRDRRPWARGAHHISVQNGVGAADLTLPANGSNWALTDATNLQVRLEVSGNYPMRLEGSITGRHGAAGGEVYFGLWVDGAPVSGYGPTGAVNAGQAMVTSASSNAEWSMPSIVLPAGLVTPGSHQFGLATRVTGASSSGFLYRNSNAPMVFEVMEDLNGGGIGNNNSN